MQMIRVLFAIFFIATFQTLNAQEMVVPDSLNLIHSGTNIDLIHSELPLLNEKTLSLSEFSENRNILFNLPLIPDYPTAFDFRMNYRAKQLNFSQNLSPGILFSPFIQGTVFNEANYRLNDRLSFGGNSFGAQTIFEPPKMNQSIQEMNIKGASMFMQYKVSDNFKVETRFSISNRSSFFEP